MLEFIFQFIGEILIQLVLEGLAELGLHSVAEPFKKTPHPGWAALGYTLFGTLAGLVSLLIFRHYLVPAPWRLVNLAVAPVVAGAAMSVLGWWRAGHGQDVIHLDRFGYGYLFALALALVRFWLAAR